LNESAFFAGQRNAIVNGSSNVDDPGAGGTFSLKISGGAATVTSGIRKLPNEHKNVSLNVFANGAVTLTDLSGNTIAELADGDVVQCVSLGDGAWSAIGRDKFSRVIDFRLYGTPDDEEYDNTPALEEALADAYESGGAAIWFGGGREWWFLTPLDSNNPLTYRHYENVTLTGIYPDFTAQHQEEGGVGIDLDNTYGTRLRLDLTAGAVWWDVQRTYRFGAMRLFGLTVKTETQCTIFRLGGVDGVSVQPCFRGLLVSGCIFSCSEQAWLNLDVGVSTGYTLPTNLGYAFDLTRGYDVVITDTTFRYFGGAGIRSKAADRAVFRNCRAIICQLLEEVQIVGAAITVLPAIEHCYAEASPYYGIVAEGGMITDLRGEMGYNDSFTPDIGNIALPAAVTWDIQIGADEIVFDNFPGAMDATNYFRPNSIVKITPDEEAATTVPPRYLYITEVASDRITFANSTGSSYVHILLSGDGEAIERVWGIPLVVVGDRCSVSGWSLEVNESTAIPVWAFVPLKKTVEISGNANTTLIAETLTPTNYAPIIVASSAGTEGLWGGVKVGTRHNAPYHPLACFDEGPEYHANYRNAMWDEAGNRQVFLPGRGVGSADDCSRDLRFRLVEDTAQGKYVWCYLLSDAVGVGWVMRKIRRAGVTVDYQIWGYASQATTLNLFGGAGGLSSHSPAGAGWFYYTGTLDGATQMLADAHGAYIQASGDFLSISKVVVTQ
jgi:hypothetical protein